MSITQNIGGYGVSIDLGWTPIRLCWQIFEDDGGKLIKESVDHARRDVILRVAEIQVRHNLWQIETHPGLIPDAYSGWYKYQKQDHHEDWIDALTLARVRMGDCDCLGLLRCAQLRAKGHKAQARLSSIWENGDVSFHLDVWREDMDRDLPPISSVQRGGIEVPTVQLCEDGFGYYEDISLILGM